MIRNRILYVVRALIAASEQHFMADYRTHTNRSFEEFNFIITGRIKGEERERASRY